MNGKIKSDEMMHLFEAVLMLKDPEECYRFFMDVCTINELNAMAQLYEVAQMLSEKMTYTEIAGVTGASTATISRVNRTLNYGDGGYRVAIERVKEKNRLSGSENHE